MNRRRKIKVHWIVPFPVPIRTGNIFAHGPVEISDHALGPFSRESFSLWSTLERSCTRALNMFFESALQELNRI